MSSSSSSTPQVLIAVCVAAVAVSSASAWGVSSQFQKQDGHGGYAYGYEDPNSQKQEQRLAGGVVQGGYSYLDGAGIVQHVKYVADPKLGFHIVGASNLPEAQRSGAGVPNDGRFGFDHAKIVIGHGGVPVDTPEVQSARAQHLAALSQAHQSGRYESAGQGEEEQRRRKRRSLIDTPEVQHAKSAHFAALNAAASGHHQSYNTGSIKHVVVPYSGPLHHPALHQGVPIDTPEVIQARNAHYTAWGSSHDAARAAGQGQEQEVEVAGNNQGAWGGQHWGNQQSQGVKAGVSAGDYYRQAESTGYKGPIHVPVIKHGVPLEPQEVIHARQAHLTAFAKAHAEAGPYNEAEEANNKGAEQWN